LCVAIVAGQAEDQPTPSTSSSTAPSSENESSSLPPEMSTPSSSSTPLAETSTNSIDTNTDNVTDSSISTISAEGASQGWEKECNNGGFDAPSFIGGIVLCGGIVAISIFALKFYQSRKENDYHTL